MRISSPFIKKKMKGDGEPDMSLSLVVHQCRNTQTLHEDIRAVAMKPDKMDMPIGIIS